MDLFFNEAFQQCLAEAGGPERKDLSSIERRIVGFDHGQVGALMLSQWKFPEVITRPIAAHHQPQVPPGTDELDLTLLQVADALPQQMGLGNSANPHPPEISPADLEYLGLKEDDLASMREFLQGASDNIHAFFSAMT